MKIKVPRLIEEEVTHVSIVAPVNYGEEEMPIIFPGRSGDEWRALIEIDTGRIVDWPAGKEAKLHLTVKDSGTYTLLGPNFHKVAMIHLNYVPSRVIPGSGDTIELTIDGNGQIKEWRHAPNVQDVMEAFFPREED